MKKIIPYVEGYAVATIQPPPTEKKNKRKLRCNVRVGKLKWNKIDKKAFKVNR